MKGSRAKERQGGCRPPAPHGVAQVLRVEEGNETQRLYWRSVCVCLCADQLSRGFKSYFFACMCGRVGEHEPWWASEPQDPVCTCVPFPEAASVPVTSAHSKQAGIFTHGRGMRPLNERGGCFRLDKSRMTAIDPDSDREET